jgi:hypothetical protein
MLQSDVDVGQYNSPGLSGQFATLRVAIPAESIHGVLAEAFPR